MKCGGGGGGYGQAAGAAVLIPDTSQASGDKARKGPECGAAHVPEPDLSAFPLLRLDQLRCIDVATLQRSLALLPGLLGGGGGREYAARQRQAIARELESRRQAAPSTTSIEPRWRQIESTTLPPPPPPPAAPLVPSRRLRSGRPAPKAPSGGDPSAPIECVILTAPRRPAALPLRLSTITSLK